MKKRKNPAFQSVSDESKALMVKNAAIFTLVSVIVQEIQKGKTLEITIKDNRK